MADSEVRAEPLAAEIVAEPESVSKEIEPSKESPPKDLESEQKSDKSDVQDVQPQTADVQNVISEEPGDVNDENEKPSATALTSISTPAPPNPAEAQATPTPNPPTTQMSGKSGTQAPPSIPPELLVKHPLQYRWVLWYCKHDRTRAWEDCLKEVTAFDTVEDFWALYNHIQLASGLSWNSDYYLFKEGIKPMWEDEHNVNGGRWLVRVDKNRRLDLLDQYWLELLMGMLGEQFDELGRHICGAVVNVRSKGDKVSLWTTDATSDEANKRIGTILKSKLHLTEPIVYEIHKETSVKQSSSIRPKLTM